MKNIRNLFIAFCYLAICNGVAYLFFAEQSLSLLGGEISGMSLLLMRYYGAIALGCGSAIWILRNSKEQLVQRALVIGIFFSMLASTVVGVSASIALQFQNFDWLFILIDSSLTLWSGYFLFKRN